MLFGVQVGEPGPDEFSNLVPRVLIGVLEVLAENPLKSCLGILNDGLVALEIDVQLEQNLSAMSQFHGRFLHSGPELCPQGVSGDRLAKEVLNTELGDVDHGLLIGVSGTNDNRNLIPGRIRLDLLQKNKAGGAGQVEVGDNKTDIELCLQDSNALEDVGSQKHLATQAFFKQASHNGGVHRLVFNVEYFHTHSFGGLRENFRLKDRTFCRRSQA